MKNTVRIIASIFAFVLLLSALSPLVFAEENAVTDNSAETQQAESADDGVSGKAMAAAIVVGIAAAAGAVGMGMAIAKAVDGIARQPEADGKIRTSLMLGLVFIETLVIYALIIAILVIFVL